MKKEKKKYMNKQKTKTKKSLQEHKIWFRLGS